MTRSVVLYELLSLDGFADDPGQGDWFDNADARLIDFLGDVIARQDAVLLGRRTFDMWASHWPTSTMQPFADFINATPKHVVSSTVLSHSWSNSTQVTGPVTPYVADLKEQPGRDIGIHGSLTLARSLLAAGLVDELRLVIAPNLAGHGTRLFDDSKSLQRFNLLSCERSGDCLLLPYRRRS